jgi:hypothetical protein
LFCIGGYENIGFADFHYLKWIRGTAENCSQEYVH